MSSLRDWADVRRRRRGCEHRDEDGGRRERTGDEVTRVMMRKRKTRGGDEVAERG